VDGPREHFLARPALSLEENWHPTLCSSSASLKHFRELMGESCQTARASKQVRAFEVRGAPRRKLAAKPEEGPSELDQGLIAKIYCLSALTMNQRAVLGPEVANAPAVLLAAQLSVGLGHPRVRQLEVEDSSTGHARHSARAPAQPHAFELCKKVARRPRQRTLAVHLEEEIRRKRKFRSTRFA
jgi:hypothetical protein